MHAGKYKSRVTGMIVTVTKVTKDFVYWYNPAVSQCITKREIFEQTMVPIKEKRIKN